MNWEDLISILNPQRPDVDTEQPFSFEDIQSAPYSRPKNWQQLRYNQLGVYEDPSMWTWVEHPTHGDWYNLGRVEHIANVAQKYNIDPYDLLGIGMSESRLGNAPQTENNPLRVFLDVHEPTVLKQYGLQNLDFLPRDEFRNILIDYAAQQAQKAFTKYPNDRLSAFQAYSGTGSVPYGGHRGQFFGKQWGGGQSMWQQKPQGRRARDLSDIARTNEDIARIIDNLLLNY